MRVLVDHYRQQRGWGPQERVSVDQLRPGDRILAAHGPTKVLTFRAVDADSGRSLFEDDHGNPHSWKEQGSQAYWRADQHPMQIASEDEPETERAPTIQHPPVEQAPIDVTGPARTASDDHDDAGLEVPNDDSAGPHHHPAPECPRDTRDAHQAVVDEEAIELDR